MVLSGKGHWLEPREDKVSLKGKDGMLQTFLLKKHLTNKTRSMSSGGSNGDLPVVTSADQYADDTLHERTQRLISWNVETLLGLLKQVVARREALSAAGYQGKTISNAEITKIMSSVKEESFLEEVKEIITLPDFDSTIARHQKDPSQETLPDQVVEQLRTYVTTLAGMYRNNSFHCFEHVSFILIHQRAKQLPLRALISSHPFFCHRPPMYS